MKAVRLHHLALRTSDLGALERFYTGVLGLTVLRRDEGRSVWLDAAGAIVMLEARERDEPSVDPTSMDLTCFGIAPEAHLGFIERLRAAGVRIEERTAYTLYFRDPDGRRVGLSSFPDRLSIHPPRDEPLP